MASDSLRAQNQLRKPFTFSGFGPKNRSHAQWFDHNLHQYHNHIFGKSDWVIVHSPSARKRPQKSVKFTNADKLTFHQHKHHLLAISIVSVTLEATNAISEEAPGDLRICQNIVNTTLSKSPSFKVNEWRKTRCFVAVHARPACLLLLRFVLVPGLDSHWGVADEKLRPLPRFRFLLACQFHKKCQKES